MALYDNYYIPIAINDLFIFLQSPPFNCVDLVSQSTPGAKFPCRSGTKNTLEILAGTLKGAYSQYVSIYVY